MARRTSGSAHTLKASWKSPLLAAVLFLFVAGGAYAGYLFYSTVRDFVAQAQLGGPAWVNTEQGRGDEQTLPNVRQERTNILLLGIDKRAGELGPSRTDTIIVVSVDPVSKSAAMLSIPRDLWVSIPGHSEGRVNTAHFLGDANGYPGGGPALAKITVQYALGIPIHYYVRINFEGFEKLVDAIGGITIDVKEAIRDDKYPDGSYGFMTVDIPAGVQHMDGKTALQYARVRHGGSDFMRGRRQQEVIKAIRDKVLSLDIPLTKIPEMLRIAGDSVHTDLSLSEMYELAKLAREFPSDSLKSAVIDESMTSPQTTPDGAQVLIPNRTKIREMINDLFGGPTPTNVAELSDTQVLALEAAKIEVQNGTMTPGLAQRTADQLKVLGYNVIAFSNADRSDYVSTLILDYSGKAKTVNLLAQRFRVAPENVRRVTGMANEADVRLVLGRDYAVTASP
jgi:LCP family protein required for cell wall assembly